MNKLCFSTIVLSAALVLPAGAQQQPAAPGAPGVGATAVIKSEPGKAMVARTIELSARVVGLDAASRTVTLKGPKGNTVDVVCGDDVRNFDQIKLGDSVHARYTESLYLELKKTKGGIREGAEREAMSRSQPGERPGGTALHEVVILADVVDVNPTKKTISLKGPKGNVLTLPVQNPDQFKVVKKGDQVEATYTQAVAIAVEPEAGAK